MATVFGCCNYCAIKTKAICFFLVLLSLVTTSSTYADVSNDAKRDKAKREIEDCLRRNEVSTQSLCPTQRSSPSDPRKESLR